MDGSPATPNRQSPHEVYSDCLQQLNRAKTHEEQREKLYGFAKLIVAAITLISAFWLLRRPVLVEFLFVPVAVFVLLAVVHEKLLHSIRLRTRSIEFYDRGIARLENRWAGKGETGERFLDPQHPYSRDLDLFGKASLFELLCTARTRAGEETLAQWLLAPASIEEILRRQAAAELKNRLDFRERLATFAGNLRQGLRPEFLAAWGEAKSSFQSEFIRILA